jgi:hypothetical protein
MSQSQQNPLRTKTIGRWRWIGIALLVSVVVIAAVGTFVFVQAEPILHARVIETLSTRFKSKVELDALNVSLVGGLQVSGKGLRVFGDMDPNNHELGFQPLISVAEFRFRTGIVDLFRSHKPLCPVPCMPPCKFDLHC